MDLPTERRPVVGYLRTSSREDRVSKVSPDVARSLDGFITDPDADGDRLEGDDPTRRRENDEFSTRAPSNQMLSC